MKLKLIITSLLLVGSACLSGCDQEGSAERAGEEVDQAMEEAGEEMEEAGEEMD